MIPFPGESVVIADAADVTGGQPLWFSLRRRAGSLTISAGDEWRFWVYPGSQIYLEEPGAGADVDVSWVVEVLSGSGTIDASWGFDPDYGDTGAAHGTSLGTHAVSGATTLVLSTTITAADVLSGADSMMLVLEATAGAVEVQQVKLRVWPVAGVVGGWSTTTLPGFGTNPTTAQIFYTTAEAIGTAENTDPETAWDDAYAEFLVNVAAVSANTSRPFATTSGGVGGLGAQASSVVDLDPDVFQSGTHLVAVLAVLRGADWRTFFPLDDSTLVEGVDWVVPPTEVGGDVAAYVQRDGDGFTGWLNAVVTITDISDGVFAMPGNGVVASTAGVFPRVSGSITVPVEHGTDTGTVPLDTAGQDISVTISHTVATGDGQTWPPEWDHPGLSGITRTDVIDYVFGVEDQPVKTYAVLPPYRVWTPTAVVVEAVKFLRVIQRGDGLGMGSGRILGARTRQGSTRVFGAP